MSRCTQAAMRAIAAAIFVIAVGAQEVAMPAIAFPAPAAEVVVLPDLTACSNEAMLAFTAKNRDCASALYWRDNPEPSCCAELMAVFGDGATTPTANCFCVKGYWEFLTELADKNFVTWSKFLDECTKMGYPIEYYDKEEGRCPQVEDEEEEGAVAAEEAALAPEAEDAAAELAGEEEEEEEEPQEVLYMRSFGAWMRDLKDSGWGATSFTFGLFSALGCAVLGWAFLFDAWRDVKEAHKLRKQAM